MDPIQILNVVDTWPRAMVASILVISLALLTYTRSTREDVKAVKRSLTTNNAGTHVKDSLDSTVIALQRIERDLGGMRSELRATNGRIDTLGHRLDHLDNRLDHHLDGS